MMFIVQKCKLFVLHDDIGIDKDRVACVTITGFMNQGCGFVAPHLTRLAQSQTPRDSLNRVPMGQENLPLREFWWHM